MPCLNNMKTHLTCQIVEEVKGIRYRSSKYFGQFSLRRVFHHAGMWFWSGNSEQNLWEFNQVSSRDCEGFHGILPIQGLGNLDGNTTAEYITATLAGTRPYERRWGSNCSRPSNIMLWRQRHETASNSFLKIGNRVPQGISRPGLTSSA